MKNQEYGCQRDERASALHSTAPHGRAPHGSVPHGTVLRGKLPTAFHSKTEPDFQTVAFP